MTSSSNPQGFLRAFFGTLGLVLTAVAATVLCVDPYARFNIVSIDGVNAQRPEFSTHARLGKAGAICRIRPAQIVLGTSRAEVGLDPRHPAFNDLPGPVYNGALAGTGIHELRLTFQHAVYASPNLKRALIGIDFLMFNAHRERAAYGTEVLDFDPRRLLESRYDTCARALLYDGKSLFGLQGLRSAWVTVRTQMEEPKIGDTTGTNRWIALYDDDGFRRKFAVLAKTVVPEKGFRGIFNGATQERYYADKIWRPGAAKRYCFEADGQPNTLDEFRAMVRLALASGLDVRFFINPVHARLLIALHWAGLWPTYEEWKRSLVAILTEEAAASGKPQLPLWDFSGFNTVTMERVPDDGDRKTQMRWYWEPSHYRKEAGDLMLDRMLGQSARSAVPDDFGVSLTKDNIEGWILTTRAGVSRYAQLEPRETNIVRTAIDDTMAEAEGSNCGQDVKTARQGAALLAQGDAVRAEGLFAQAQRMHASDRAQYAEIDAPYRENGFETTLREARAGRHREPDLASWIEYQTRGIERSKRGDLMGAADDFRTAIKIGPPNTALHFLRGTALLGARAFGEAASEFQKGLDLDPTNGTLQSLRRQAASKAAEPP